MRKFLLCAGIAAMLFALPGYLPAQTKNKLSGTISDSAKALSYVTVRMYKQNNPAPLQTTLSKDNGSFQLNKPAEGNYTLTFSHTGFVEKKVDVAVTSAAGDMQIDPVQLSKATGTLKEVVVNAKRPLVETTDDKIVFNVEDDPTSKTETAIDLLRKTPFITVDGEDNIKVNGKTNFKVLLNNRETTMFARNVKEALRGFPGALISKIEVITSPSAKYDGEGIGGLINIITKKKIAGYNGTISSFNRTVDKINHFSLNGNAKVGKLGASAFLNSGFSNPVSQHNISTTIPLMQSTYTKRTLEGDQRTNSGWSFGNAELSWEFDSLNTVSVYTNIDSWRNTTVSDQTITTDYASSPSSVSYYNLNNKTHNPGISVGSDYIKHFKNKKDREFSFRFLGDFGKNESELNSFQDNPVTDRFLVNNSYANNNQYTLQADNSIPMKKNSKLDAGVKAILRRASSDFESLVKYDETDNYKINTSNTDKFKYKQDVVSVYSMYTFRVKKSSFRIGTRVEHTNVDGDFISSNTRVKNSYTTLLPNIQFTNRLSTTTTLVINYNKRLSRPYIWDLNPFVFNNDSLNITFGNPGLGPQTIHAVSTQLRYGKGSTFAGINVEGSYSGNKILQYSSFDPGSGITETTSLNIGKEFSSSVNVNLNTKITPKADVFFNGSLRYSNVTNNANSSQSNSGFGCNITLNASYKFTGKFTVSSFLGFWREPRTIQTIYPLMSWHNVAFNYKAFKNKVNISLRAVNYLHKSFDHKIIIRDPNFTSTNIRTLPRRAAVLALTWNFGKLTENVSKKKGVNNDDLLNRPAAPTGNQ